jgi:hypothetical protein
VLLALAGSASAHPVAGRSFGLGLEIGQPSAITAYASLGQYSAIDFALGFPTFDDRYLYLHLDYLVMPVDLARGGSLSVPLYLGIGGFLYDFHDDIWGGVRVPFGIALDFRTAPLQVFFELAVKVLLIRPVDVGDRVDLDGVVGFRVFF